MTIGKKLFLGFLLVIAVMTIMGAVNIFLYDKAGRMYDKINDIFYANMKMDEAVTDLVQWANDLNNQLFFEKPFKKELDPYKSAFGKWYYTFKSDNPKVMNIYATMEEPYLRLHNTAQKALEFYQNGDKEGAQKIFLQELTPSFNEILEISKNLSNITIVEIERIISERRRIDRLTDMAIPTLLCIGTTLGIVMALLITRGISVQIRNAFLRITSSSHRILTFSQQQAVGIEEEATCVSENTASSKQLSLTAKQVTDYANEIAKSSVLSTDMANAGSQSVSNVVDGMDKIRQSILETAKKIEALGETSRTITEIATLIEDIADQTNLLSLNATIEATRAGEAGKGFATVADAIGKLADRTTKSTKDISLLIKEIQQDISSCIISMEQSTKETEKGASLAQEAGKKLKEIVSSFKYVAESAKKISLASQQQALGSEQISKSMINIDEIMKKSATSAKQLTNLAKELYGLAEDMKKMVGQSNLYEETTPHN